MKGNKTIAFFDFDGTITTKDIFGNFLLYRLKNGLSILKFISCLPTLVLYYLKLIRNDTAKEKIFNKLFNGEPVNNFAAWAKLYSDKILPSLIRQSAIKKIHWHKNQGHEVYVVSANFDLLLKDFADHYQLELICTQLEIENALLTGKFASPNCYGDEKVKRVMAHFLQLDTYKEIYTYGDSNGDKPLLAISTHQFYRHFYAK
ncbi:hypothetical protein A0256_16770 [Mucilaginibacter sp. PAMC 26640]|nr:hypothetical protein A0256_16770 [Mucilaginibacter sp. PAMC 26640]